MDERELEARLHRRLHARFDVGGASPALRSRVADIVAREPRRAGLAWWRIAGLAATAVIVMAVIAVGTRYATLPGASPSQSPTPIPTTSPSPSSTPSPPPTAVPTATVPPVSTSAWTDLDVAALPGAPAGIERVVSWAGGYVALAQTDADPTETAWSSPDGRTWTQLPSTAFGLGTGQVPDSIIVWAGSSCRSGILIATEDTDGAGASALWYSTDGSTWAEVTITGGVAQQLAGNGSGAIAVTDRGLYSSADCTTWQAVALPGPKGARALTVAAFGTGFVAAGGDGPVDGGATVEPVAWWSADGQHWTQANVPSSPSFAFTLVAAGNSGLTGVAFTIGRTPGADTLWTSTDGHAWKPEADSADPLGVQSEGEGVGGFNGDYSGDGIRLLLFGNPTFEGSVPDQAWVSFDATHWTQLTISGGAAAAAADPTAQVDAFLMRDGILFSGPGGTWFGSATP